MSNNTLELLTKTNTILVIAFILLLTFVLAIVFMKEKYKNKIKEIVKLPLLFILAIIIPIQILSICFNEVSSLVMAILFIIIIWYIISTILRFKNFIIISMNKEKEIYIRDVPVDYSPAVLSYLMNNKIETKKDLSATLLNLCVKNVLKISEGSNNKLEIKDLKNEQQVTKLSNDEKYAYNMFIEGITISKINIWKMKVEEEYQKYNFSKKHKRNLFGYLFLIYVAIIILIYILKSVNISNLLPDLIYQIPFIAMAAVYEILIFNEIKKTISKKINKKYEKSEFIDTYTIKGAIEYNRWKKFEKFIKDYTLIKDKNYESYVVLGKYLSYSIALGINRNCDSEIYNRINKKYFFNYNIFKDFEE